ncbi:hypothetical protein AcW1_008777 [Taiwanofungus camphoratus]|nr:hypothetical protein AcW1_008777 [Antrodia cinnamomea]
MYARILRWLTGTQRIGPRIVFAQDSYGNWLRNAASPLACHFICRPTGSRYSSNSSPHNSSLSASDATSSLGIDVQAPTNMEQTSAVQSPSASNNGSTSEVHRPVLTVKKAVNVLNGTIATSCHRSHSPFGEAHSPQRVLIEKIFDSGPTSSSTESPLPEDGSSDFSGRMGKSSMLYPLPTIPPMPEDSCCHLTDQEVKKYLEPLYARNWYVGQERAIHRKETRVIIHLAKVIKLERTHLAFDFFKELIRLLRRGAVNASCGTKYGIIKSGRLVTFSTFTPSAVRADVPDIPFREHKQPGITLRDVRLAFLVEHCSAWQLAVGNYKLEHQLEHTKLQHTPASLFGLMDALSNSSKKRYARLETKLRKVAKAKAHELQADGATAAKTPRCFKCRGPHFASKCPNKAGQRKTSSHPDTRNIHCTICLGFHHMRDCPNRAQFKPRGPCPFCASEDHWGPDCPKAKEGSEPPVKEFTYCGG